MMTTYFFLGLLILIAVIFLAFTYAEDLVYIPVIFGSLAAVFLYCVVWEVESQYTTYDKVETESCEIARTDSKVFVDCGDLQTTTSNHYVYENLGKTSKVEIYRAEEKNVFGTEDIYLEIKRNQ